MTILTFNVHLPLVRINEPTIPFLGGTLWKMPFETFDGLTSGAFESQKYLYDQTMPVFFNFENTVEDTPWMNQSGGTSNAVMEMKLVTSEEGYIKNRIDIYPFNIFRYIHDKLMDTVWETLILAVPTGQFIQPRHSITFINADNDAKYFKVNDDFITSMANFRGDADVEYLFMPEAYGNEVDLKMLKEAEECYKLHEFVHSNADLAEALTALKSSNLPYINRQEQFTICFSALENLIIPEVYKDISKTFAHRVGAILSKSPEEYYRTFETSKFLYGLRSQTIHGQESKGESYSAPGRTQVILSSCIKALAEEIREGKSLNKVFEEVDAKSSDKPKEKVKISSLAIVNDSVFKHLKEEVAATATLVPYAKTTSESENTILFWSPLIGMETAIDIEIPSCHAFFTSLNANDLMSLEDKDIKRDFMGQIVMSDKISAALCIPYLVEEGYTDIKAGDSMLKEFESIRNLLVVGLRLSGFKKFLDPELLGNYMFKRSMRYRQASVLRQSVFMNFRKDPMESLREPEKEKVLRYWDLLGKYQSDVPSPEIELILSLYRRISEYMYMPVISRASLSFILLEKLLGPFRSGNEPVQLEDLIVAAIGENEITMQFHEKGRETRNSIAHGYWDPGKGMADFLNLVQVLDNLLPLFLDTWIKKPDNTILKPRDVFIKRILSLKV